MNILFTSDQYTPAVNGVVTHIVFLREEMRKRGHNVYILTSKRPGSKVEKDVFYAPSVYFFLRPMDTVAIPFTTGVMKQMNDLPFDIIHNHFFMTGFMGMKLAKKKNVPMLATLHLTFQTYVDWLFPKGGRALRPVGDAIAKSYLSTHDFVASPSLKGKKDLERIGIKPPVEVIHNGIILPDVDKVHGENFRKEYNIDPKTPIIVTSGRVDKGKNVDLAVEAFAELVKKMPDIKLVIAGDGPQRGLVEKVAQDLGVKESVVFTGMLSKEKIYEVYKESSALLFASDSDMLPTVIIEAFAFGIPAITIREDAPLEIVKDGINGIFADKKASSLADAGYKLLSSTNLHTFKKEALKSASEYSLEKNVDALLAKYQELIDDKKKQ